MCVLNVDSVGLAGVSGSQYPPLGVGTSVHGRGDQLRDRSDVGLAQHVVSADVRSVLRFVSSFVPESLLFAFSDSVFSFFSSSAPPASSFSSSSSLSVTSAPSFATPSTVPVYSLPSVVPSLLYTPLPSARPLPSSSSFLSGPPPGFPPMVSYLPSSSPSPFTSSFCPVASSSSSSSWFSVPPSSAVSASSVLPPVSSSPSSPLLDFVSYQARVLGLSDEYQALGRWYFASRGADFPAYPSAHFPHLYSDFRLDFSSESSCFLSTLASASPPPESVPSSGPLPHSLPSSLPRSSAPSSSPAYSLSSAFFPTSAFSFSVRPGASVPSSAPSAPLAPPLSHPPGFYPSVSSSPFPVRPSASLLQGASMGVPVSAGVGFAAHLLFLMLLLFLLPLSFVRLPSLLLLPLALPLLRLLC